MPKALPCMIQPNLFIRSIKIYENIFKSVDVSYQQKIHIIRNKER